MHNVLLLETIAPDAVQMLEQHTQLLKASSPFTGLEIAEKHPIHAIVTRGKGDVSKALIAACPDLQVIARCGVGLDNVDVAFASQQGVKVINAPGINADTVAEQTLALMLSLQRKLYTAILEVKNGNWEARKQYSGDEIRGKTLGILGMGNIGQKVAKLATAFGMKVIYWEIEDKKIEYEYKDFETVLRESNIVSLHLPLVEATHNLINQDALSLMQSSCLLINTARGGLIEQQSLYQALKDEKIGGFAADVLAAEPPAQDELLLQLENVLITPHTASLTALTYNEMCVLTVENAINLLAGKKIEERFLFN
ncbi:MAG: NAD(P)-dependent oxidoreductase [Bacteroidota bacterium]